MLRHALKPTSPDDARETMIELARLAVWASGSADAARALDAALPAAVTVSDAMSAGMRAVAASDAAVRSRGVGADLVGEILNRVSSHAELDDERGEPVEIPPPVNTSAAREPARTLVRCAGEDAGWLLSRDGGDALDRVIVRGVGELEIVREVDRRGAAHYRAVRDERTEIASCRMERGGHVWTVERMGSVESSRTLAVLDAWSDAQGMRPRNATPGRTPTRSGSRWAHLKKQ